MHLQKPRRLPWLIGAAFLVLILNVAMSFLYMVVYSYAIDPGHDEAYYQAHAQIAAPYCSIVAGIPLMFLAGRWAGGVRAGMTIWLSYAVIDVSVLLAVGMTAEIAVFVATSLALKLAAVYGGAIYAGSFPSPYPWRARR